MSGPVRRALLIGGSPKGRKGASWNIGGYLVDQLEQQGVEVRRRAVRPLGTVFEDLAWADLVVLSFPLYADGVPALVLGLLERIRDSAGEPKALVAICNSGFPESHQNRVALRICARFCQETGWRWLGGVARGAGGALPARPLAQAGGMFEKTRRALCDGAVLLAHGKPLPPELIARAEAPLMPGWAYRTVGSLGMLRSLRRAGVFRRRHDRPFDKLADPWPE